MDRLAIAALTGGFLAILVFIHFFVDWIFQSHDEAMVKHNNWKVRAKHCAIYTFPFIVFLYWCDLSSSQLLIAAAILFFSHFIEDTYYPVLLWAKYIRRPPEMQWRISGIHGKLLLIGPKIFVGPFPQRRDTPIGEPETWRDKVFSECGKEYSAGFRDDCNRRALNKAQRELDHRGFKEFIDGTMGKVLMIAIDQIIHISFLIPIALMLVYK